MNTTIQYLLSWIPFTSRSFTNEAKSQTCNIPTINDLRELFTLIASSSKPTFLKIGSSSCRPCVRMDKVLGSLAEDPALAGIQFLKAEETSDIAKYFRPESIPHFISFPPKKFQPINDKHVTFSGEKSLDRLKQELIAHLLPFSKEETRTEAGIALEPEEEKK